MNQNIEHLYQNIGREACGQAIGMNGRLLVYAELEDAVISASLFYEKGANKTVIFKYCSDELEGTLYKLWDIWNKQGNGEQWAAISYLIENGKFDIELTYPEQMIKGEDLHDRRPKIIEKYFGKTEVDYSNPE